MSANVGISYHRLRQQFERWRFNNHDTAYLGTRSMNEIHRELRAWIDRRRHTYNELEIIYNFSLLRAHAIIIHVDNGDVPPTDVRRRRMEEDRRHHLRELDLIAQQIRQAFEAYFLCESLKATHRFSWRPLREPRHRACNDDVVGALVALGQGDVDMQTLIHLDGREAMVQEAKRNSRQVQQEALYREESFLRSQGND